MRTYEKKFRDYLAAHALRCTSQRRAVLQEAFAQHGHFDAEGLLDVLRRQGNRASRATVYRTLGHLVECGLVKEVLHCRGKAHYEHTFGHEHHDHLVCVECGRVIEFTCASIEREQRRICEEFGFRPIEHRLGIKGICKSCCQKETPGDGKDDR